MKSVYILCDYGFELALFLKLRKLDMGDIGLYAVKQYFLPVKPVELLGIPHKEGMADDLLRRIIILLVVETVYASEVGYAAFGGHARSAKEYNVAAAFYHL